MTRPKKLAGGAPAPVGSLAASGAVSNNEGVGPMSGFRWHEVGGRMVGRIGLVAVVFGVLLVVHLWRAGSALAAVSQTFTLHRVGGHLHGPDRGEPADGHGRRRPGRQG